jgi:vitamin B12 transporter
VKGTTRNKAAFAHLEMGMGENLTIGGGYRHDDSSVFDKAGTWSATALLSFPESGTRFRGNFGEGIRAPTPVEFADPFVGNEDLKEERSTSYDVGMEQEFMEGDILLAATWFRLDTRDLIAFDPDSGPTGLLENFERTRTTGWELHGRARLFEELTVSGFWTVQDPEDRTAGPGEEEQLPGRPKWFGGGTAELRTGGFMAAVDLYTSGEYPATGKIDPDGDVRDQPGRKLLVTIRSAIAFAGGGMAYARVENLFDYEYYDSETGPEGLGVRAAAGVSWTF